MNKQQSKLNDSRHRDVLACIEHYSNGTNRCAWEGCDEDRIEAMCLDHKIAQGPAGRNGGWISPLLRKLGFPDGYQILCANHNHEKALIFNEHKGRILVTPEEIEKRRKKDLKDDMLRWEVLSTICESPIPYCQECGRTYLWHLTIDHVNDDGAEDRKKYGCGGLAFYAKLKKLGYPDMYKYQVLCHNCNLIKARRKSTKGYYVKQYWVHLFSKPKNLYMCIVLLMTGKIK